MTLSLRKVREEDKRLLFDWANDPETRKNSFSTSPIPWPVHEQWFEERTHSKNTRIYIGQNEQGEEIGQIRFERAENHAQVGFSIDRAFRGKGFGSAILVKGCEAIFQEWKEIESVVGLVKRNNEASRRALIRASFVEEDPGGDRVLYWKHRS